MEKDSYFILFGQKFIAPLPREEGLITTPTFKMVTIAYHHTYFSKWLPLLLILPSPRIKPLKTKRKEVKVSEKPSLLYQNTRLDLQESQWRSLRELYKSYWKILKMESWMHLVNGDIMILCNDALYR